MWSTGFQNIPCLQICFLCGATKGNDGDLDCAFTNISHDAGWWATMGQQVPWTVPPSFSMIRGFHGSMLMPDLLHCWNLGLARDLLGSSLKIIFQQRIIFTAATLDERMMCATESLRKFAKENGHPLRCRKITKGKLVWHSRKYPSLSVSGYDAYVIGLWLEELVSGYTQQYPEISSMLWLSNRAISLMYSSESWFLSQEEKILWKSLGLRSYAYTCPWQALLCSSISCCSRCALSCTYFAMFSAHRGSPTKASIRLGWMKTFSEKLPKPWA